MMPTTAVWSHLLLTAAGLLLLLPPPFSAAESATEQQGNSTRITPVRLQEEEAGPKLTPEELELSLEQGLERFERSADQWTLVAREHYDHQITELVHEFQRDLARQDRERRRRDFPGLPDQLWHSYKYNTGVGNREELTLHSFYKGLQLNVSGPPLDAPPQWQVVSHRRIFFLFGLYSFAGTTKVHIVRTDFQGTLVQATVDFRAADLRITPFLHHVHSSQGVKLFAFVKRPVSVSSVYANGSSEISEQVSCFLVDQQTLHTREVCSPITLSAGVGTAEVLVDVLLDSYTGEETIGLFPVQQTYGLVVYKLSPVPFSNTYNLGLHSQILTNSTVWKVRLFSVSGSSYVVISYGNGPLDTWVQVFRHDSGAFTLVQTLPVTSYVIDIEVFHIGFQHYLALAQESRMSLYIWHYAEFKLIQDEPSQLTYKWTVVAVKSCRHEVILAKVFSSGGYQVEFYRHNVQTQHFELVPSVPCTNGLQSGEDLGCFRRPGELLDLSELVGVTTENATYIAVPSKIYQLLLVTVNATVDFAPDPVRLQNERLLKRKAELQAKYESLLKKKDRVQLALNHQVHPGTAQYLIGNFNFLGNVAANTLDAQSTAFSSVHLPGYSGEDALGLATPLKELTGKVDALEKAIASAAEKLRDVVRTSSPSIVISGRKKAIGGVSIGSLTATGPVHINAVQDRDLNNTLSNMVRVDSDRLISGTKTVSTAFSVSTELTVARLNGRPVSDIVTSDTIQEVTGRLTYGPGALTVETLSVNGLVGGVAVSQLALYHGDGRLTVPVSISSLKATSLTVSQINGQRPEEVFSNVLLRSGGTFTDSVTFRGHVTLRDITINGMLNGENAAACLSSIIYTDSAQHLDALWLSNALVTGSLSPKTVDSRPFPGGHYVTRGGSHVISGRKTLHRVEVSRVTAARVDGVPVAQLVTLDADQTLASLSVTSGHVLGALTVGGKIDGVTVAPGWLDHLLTNDSQTLDANVIFSGRVTQLGSLKAANINGESVGAAFGGLVVPEMGRAVTVTGKKRFTAAVTADAVTVGGLVNSADPRHWLTVSGDQRITGPLILAGHGYFANMVAKTVDGVDIAALIQDAIYTDSEQEQLIYGVKAFAEPVIMSKLIIDGPVNDVGSGEILWTTGNQTVTGAHTYTGLVRAGGLHASGNLVVPDGAHVGGLDFSDLPSLAAKTANDTHTEKMIFDKVVVRGDVLADQLNRADMKDLTANVLRRSGGRITGRWRFESLRVKGSVTSAHGAGGYHLSQLAPRVISLSRGGTLRAPVFFESLVVEDGGRVDGRVVLGGTPWEGVMDNLASQHRPIVINASKTFSGGLHVIGRLQSPSLPLEKLLYVAADQVVTGSAFFHADVTVHSALTVQRPINDRYDVTGIESLFVTDTEDVAVDGDLEIWGEASISNLHVSGLLAGLPVTTLLSNAIPLNSSTQLTGQLTFLSPMHSPTLHLTDGLLNGRDLIEFLSTVRLATEDQVFGYPARAGNVTLGAAEVRDLTVDGLLNGINCTELLQRLIYLDGNYVFSGLWTLPSLSVSGELSLTSINVQFPDRLLRLDGIGVLERLNVTGDVYATEVRNATRTTTLNGYNLREEVNGRFRLSPSAPQTFMGTVTFTGRAVVNGNIVLGGRLNGFNVSQFIVLGKNNDILANLQFTGPVSADRVFVRGPVDGVNITQCAASAVYPDRNQTLHGQYAVSTALVEGSSSRRQVGMENAEAEVTTLLEQCEIERRDFNDFFRSQCLAMRGLYDEMRSTYYAVRYFDELQEPTWPDLDTVLSTLAIEEDSGDFHVLVTYTRLSAGCPESRLFRWRADSGLLQPSGVPYNCGAVRQWRHLSLDGRRLLVAAAEMRQGCDGPMSAVWLWSRGRIQLLQNLDMASTQVSYTAARPGVPAQLRFLDSAGGLLTLMSYSPAAGEFVTHPPQTTHAGLLAVRTLPDSSLLVLSGQEGTVVALRLSTQQTVMHEQHLGKLLAVSVLIFSRRGGTMIAVGDGGWSSLVNSPQGVKIFEYFGNGTHRCVPVQHLAAVSPVGLALFSAGSLPDLFLAVVERDCGLRLFIDKGEAGFVEFQRVTVPGAESVIILGPDSGSPPRLLVSAGRRLVLLEAQMVGAHLPSVETDCAARLPPLRFEEAEGQSGAEEGEREGGGTEVVARGQSGQSGSTTPVGVTSVGVMGGGAMMGGTGGDR